MPTFGGEPSGEVGKTFLDSSRLQSAGFDETVTALPFLFEHDADARALSLGAFGSECRFGSRGDEACGFLLGEFEKLAIAHKVGDSKFWESSLPCSEELAGAAHGEIELGKFETILGANHGVEALFSQVGDALPGDENAVALRGTSADTATELVKLSETEALGVFDDHDGGVGDVDAHFDDCGCHEDVDLSALKAAHDDFLVVGVEPAVEQAETEACKWADAEFLVHLDCRLQLRGLVFWRSFLAWQAWKQICSFSFASGFAWRSGRGLPGGFCRFVVREIELGLIVFCAFDDWINDVSLAALRHLLADEIPNIAGTFFGNAARNDRRATGGKLVENTDVEIAVERESQRAGNGGGCHDQDVGLGLIRLLHQLEALQDAETMLFVDDDEAEVVEFNFFFNEGVGTDDQVCLAAIDESTIQALAVFVEGAGEKNNAIAARRALEQFARGEEMLRSKDFGRSHEGSLETVLDGHEHGLKGHDGFAGSDIALEEAAHGAGLAHVGDDFAKGTFLRGSGMERQHFTEGFAHFVGSGEPDTGTITHATAFELETKFEIEKFFKDEATMRGGREGLKVGHRGAFGRKVDFAQGSLAVGEIEAGEHGLGQAFRHHATHGLEEVEDDLALPAGREAAAAQ